MSEERISYLTQLPQPLTPPLTQEEEIKCWQRSYNWASQYIEKLEHELELSGLSWLYCQKDLKELETANQRLKTQIQAIEADCLHTEQLLTETEETAAHWLTLITNAASVIAQNGYTEPSLMALITEVKNDRNT